MNEPVHKADTMGMGFGTVLAGLTAITLNQWVAIATLVYFIIQVLISLPKAIDTVGVLRTRYGRPKK